MRVSVGKWTSPGSSESVREGEVVYNRGRHRLLLTLYAEAGEPIATLNDMTPDDVRALITALEQGLERWRQAAAEADADELPEFVDGDEALVIASRDVAG